jgi:hypothetical protein
MVEGTGVAPHRRSALFRTNSRTLTTHVLKTSPFPHASVIMNAAMAYVRRFHTFHVAIQILEVTARSEIFQGWTMHFIHSDIFIIPLWTIFLTVRRIVCNI